MLNKHALKTNTSHLGPFNLDYPDEYCQILHITDVENIAL